MTVDGGTGRDLASEAFKPRDMEEGILLPALDAKESEALERVEDLDDADDWFT
jgi:hypothetical protein